MTQKVFILGIGAHKGGTTWLADQFKKAGAKFPLGKEAHIWDFIQKQETGEIAGGGSWLTKTKPKWKRKRRVTVDKERIRNDPSSYSSYYYNFSIQNNVSFVGDITPLYSALSIETLTRIRRELVDEGFQVKVFFSARDPYSRVWSAIRFELKRNQKNKPNDSNSRHSLNTSNAQSLLKFRYNKAGCEQRTRYDLIIPKLKNVFSEDELKICFFEEITTKKGYADLANFIGLESSHAELESPSRVSPSIEETNLELKKTVVNYYSDTYKYMVKAFPKSKELWANSIRLLESKI